MEAGDICGRIEEVYLLPRLFLSFVLCVSLLLLSGCQTKIEPMPSTPLPSIPVQHTTNPPITEKDITDMLDAGKVSTIWETELTIGKRLPPQELVLENDQLNVNALVETLALMLFPSVDADSRMEMFTEAFQLQMNRPGYFQAFRLEAKEERTFQSPEDMDSYADQLADIILAWTKLTGYSVFRTEYDTGSRESSYILEWNGVPLYDRFYGTGSDSGVQGPYLNITVDAYGLAEIYADALGYPSDSATTLSAEDMLPAEDISQVLEASAYTYGGPIVQVVDSAELSYYPVDNDGTFNVAWWMTVTQYAKSGGELISFQVPVLINATTGNLIN